MPPPVRVADEWMRAYSSGDNRRVEGLTHSNDRGYLRDAITAGPDNMLGGVLPPRPIAHEIEQILEKHPERWVVEFNLHLTNPLPSSAKRIGASIAGLPETRTQKQRVLIVRPHGQEPWVVKLDLPQVIKRAHYGAEVLKLVAQKSIDKAEARLVSGVPHPPDNGNVAHPDHLKEKLQILIDKAKQPPPAYPER